MSPVSPMGLASSVNRPWRHAVCCLSRTDNITELNLVFTFNSSPSLGNICHLLLSSQLPLQGMLKRAMRLGFPSHLWAAATISVMLYNKRRPDQLTTDTQLMQECDRGGPPELAPRHPWQSMTLLQQHKRLNTETRLHSTFTAITTSIGEWFLKAKWNKSR